MKIRAKMKNLILQKRKYYRHKCNLMHWTKDITNIPNPVYIQKHLLTANPTQLTNTWDRIQSLKGQITRTLILCQTLDNPEYQHYLRILVVFQNIQLLLSLSSIRQQNIAQRNIWHIPWLYVMTFWGVTSPTKKCHLHF